MKKKKNLDSLFYIKDFERFRFNSLKLIISQILSPRENQRKKLNPLFYVKDFG
jgi:hypothetical protein